MIDGAHSERVYRKRRVVVVGPRLYAHWLRRVCACVLRSGKFCGLKAPDR